MILEKELNFSTPKKGTRTKEKVVLLRENKSYSKLEEQYLLDYWGLKPIKAIAKHLNRSVEGVRRKADRLGLGGFIDSGEYITLYKLIEIAGKEKRSAYSIIQGWIKKGLPYKKKKVVKSVVKVIKVKDFWEWASVHRMYVDFSKFDTLALGKEPEWVKDKRIADTLYAYYRPKEEWTEYEDKMLLNLLKLNKYNYPELSKTMRRTESAILKRIQDLQIIYLPLSAKGEAKPWLPEHDEIIISLYNKGYRPDVIRDYLDGRSAFSISARISKLIKMKKLIRWS